MVAGWTFPGHLGFRNRILVRTAGLFAFTAPRWIRGGTFAFYIVLGVFRRFAATAHEAHGTDSQS